MQRQAAVEIKPIPVPPNDVDEPIAECEDRPKRAQLRLGRAIAQRQARGCKQRDQQPASCCGEKMQATERHEGIPGAHRPPAIIRNDATMISECYGHVTESIEAPSR